MKDHSYWIKPVAIDLTWKDVNFYTNDFQATKILDDLGSIDCRGKTNFTPSATLKGDLKKKWILSDGERVLIKGNYGSDRHRFLIRATVSFTGQRRMQDCRLERNF